VKNAFQGFHNWYNKKCGDNQMKIRIELDENLNEEEVIIRCSHLDEKVIELQTAISEAAVRAKGLGLYKGSTEYYMPIEKILFFETENNAVSAHTAEDMFETHYKLYELEELLPNHFIRISKSSIVNINHIYAINRNLTAASAIEFVHSHKQIYVSRSYYRSLREKLEEKRMR